MPRATRPRGRGAGPRSRPPIAEAHEVASAGWSSTAARLATYRAGRRRRIRGTPAIDHGVDSEAEAAEVECVCDFEPRGQSALGRFRAGPRDRGRRNVDAGDIGATTGRQQRVLAGAAASVEKASGQAALVSEPDKSRLRPADVPRGRRVGRVAGVPLRVRLFRHESVPPQNRGPGPSLSRRGRSPGASPASRPAAGSPASLGLCSKHSAHNGTRRRLTSWRRRSRGPG